jgi:hypothetical protein
MAHYAEVSSGEVQRVLVVSNEKERQITETGVCLWLAETHGGVWLKTSYNSKIRKMFAGIGYNYDPSADLFYPPKPYPSWSLDENFDWQPPVPRPSEGAYVWNETNQEWIEL